MSKVHSGPQGRAHEHGVLASLLMMSVWLFASTSAAQITPPGMGAADAAAWSALGLRESLDAEHRRAYLGYVGVGATHAAPEHDSFVTPSILVLNHELSDHFRPHWLASLGLSYRRQNAYEQHEPGVSEQKRLQELRLYGRYALVLDGARWKLQTTFRPELRGFVRPDFGPIAEPLQLRFRLKAQLRHTLTGSHALVGSAEVLASTSRARSREARWGELAYRESRFALFYSFQPRDHLTVDVGYMNDLLGQGRARVDVHYLAVDLVWVDLFRHAHG